MERYAAGRQDGEMFKDFIKRMGKVELKNLLDDLARLPADPSDRSIFTDWGDPREYSLADMGIGECAGEVVSAIEFDLAGAEREVFEAQVEWENGQIERAGKLAYQAMLHAAKGLIKLENSNISDDPGQIADEFRARYYDTQKFFDPFAGGKFAQYLFAAHEKAGRAVHLRFSTLPDRRGSPVCRSGARLLPTHGNASERLARGTPT